MSGAIGLEQLKKLPGFTAQRRNLAVVGDEWLGNTTMTKAFAKDGAAATPPTRH